MPRIRRQGSGEGPCQCKRLPLGSSVSTHLLIRRGQGRTLDMTMFGDITEDALKLLGNASSQISKVRRKRVLKVCNPDLTSLVEKEDLFVEAALSLFGNQFATKMKDRAEAVKILHKSQSHYHQPTATRHPYFRGSRPSQPQRRGGFNTRGTNHFNPYRSYNTY